MRHIFSHNRGYESLFLLLFQFVSCWGFSVSGQIPSDNLFIHLSFDNTYNDLSGNGNIPVAFGTSFTSDRFGCENSACYFDGTSTLVFPNQARFHPLTSNSVSFWLKTTQNSRFDLIVQRTGSNDPDKDNYTIIYNHNLYGNEWSFPHYTGLNTVIRNIPITDFNDGGWHHFVYVKDVETEKMSVFYDGNLVVSKHINDYNFSIHGTLTIGKWVNYYFIGAFDDFRVYNRALTNDEILALYNECDASCLEIDLGEDTYYCHSFTQILEAGNQFPHYLWSTGDTTQSITVSSPGTYWVKGYFDNDCDYVDSIQIKQFSDSVINLGTDVVLCYGESKTLDCGDCFQSYRWNTGDTVSSISVNESGNYSVEAINFNGDTVVDEIYISVLPKIEINLGEHRYVCSENSSVELIAGEGFENYLWNTGQKDRAIVVGPGKYWVQVTDQNACTASDTIQVLVKADIVGFLYPNPASNYLIIEIKTFCFSENPVVVEVFDMGQRLILKQEIQNGTNRIQIPYDMSEAPYIVRIMSGKQVVVKKLVVKKSLY